MKKIVSFILMIVMILGICSCGSPPKVTVFVSAGTSSPGEKVRDIRYDVTMNKNRKNVTAQWEVLDGSKLIPIDSNTEFEAGRIYQLDLTFKVPARTTINDIILSQQFTDSKCDSEFIDFEYDAWTTTGVSHIRYKLL